MHIWQIILAWYLLFKVPFVLHFWWRGRICGRGPSWDRRIYPVKYINIQSKDEKLIWSLVPPSDRLSKLTIKRGKSHHGPTAYARSRTDDINSTFSQVYWRGGAEHDKPGGPTCMASSGERWIESTCRHMWVCRFSLVCTTPVKKLRLIYGMLSLVGQFSVLAWHSRCFIKSKEWFDSMIKTQEKIVMHKAMLLPYEMYGISRCLFCQWCTIQSLIWLWMST